MGPWDQDHTKYRKYNNQDFHESLRACSFTPSKAAILRTYTTVIFNLGITNRPSRKWLNSRCPRRPGLGQRRVQLLICAVSESGPLPSRACICGAPTRAVTLTADVSHPS